jgi:hypothetical protein
MPSKKTDSASGGMVPSRMASKATGSQAASRMIARSAVAEHFNKKQNEINYTRCEAVLRAMLEY